MRLGYESKGPALSENIIYKEYYTILILHTFIGPSISTSAPVSLYSLGAHLEFSMVLESEDALSLCLVASMPVSDAVS